MSKGSRRRPFDQKKFSDGWEAAFGYLHCTNCDRRVRKHEAKPLPGKGKTGLLCPQCRKDPS